jgi:hypothetical protein
VNLFLCLSDILVQFSPMAPNLVLDSRIAEFARRADRVRNEVPATQVTVTRIELLALYWGRFGLFL